MNLNIKPILFTIVLWIAVLACVEFVCSLIVGNKFIALDPIDEQSSRTMSGYFEPFQDKYIMFQGLDRPYHVTTDALGFRSVGNPLKYSLDDVRNKYKILCVGDSMTFGHFLDDEASYPYQLQQKLKSNGKDAVVFNAGIGSSTISDFLDYLKRKGLALKPNLVVINFFDNDLYDLGREKSRYELMIEDSHLTMFDKFKMASFMRIFRNFELTRRFRRSTSRISDPEVKEIIFQRKNGVGDVLKVDAYHAKLIATNPFSDELKTKWKEYFDNVDQIRQLLDQKSIDLVFLIYPSVTSVFTDNDAKVYQSILRPSLDLRGIPYIDIRPILQSRRDEYLKLYLNLPLDFHLSGAGLAIVVDELYQMIEDRIPAVQTSSHE